MYAKGAALAYQALPPDAGRDIAMVRLFWAKGWHKGMNFLTEAEWRSLITSASGHAGSRSTLQLPWGFRHGERLSLSFMTDSGAALYARKGNIQSLYPTFQSTSGFEDTQVFTGLGAKLADFGLWMESELGPRGAGPERWIASGLLARPVAFPDIRPQYPEIADIDLFEFSLATGAAPVAATVPEKTIKSRQIREMIWRITAAAGQPLPEGDGFWLADNIAYLAGDQYAQVIVWNFNEISDITNGGKNGA